MRLALLVSLFSGIFAVRRVLQQNGPNGPGKYVQFDADDGPRYQITLNSGYPDEKLDAFVDELVKAGAWLMHRWPDIPQAMIQIKKDKMEPFLETSFSSDDATELKPLSDNLPKPAPLSEDEKINDVNKSKKKKKEKKDKPDKKGKKDKTEKKDKKFHEEEL